ncbi:MAG: hypothetical protein K8R44_01335 [Sulfurimonas sp.]|nr:hypothetical protein [Sulfurimonas sp.]
MKNLLTVLILLLSSITLADELKWVDEQIEAIKPPRDGISSSKINAARDPFIFLKKNKDESKKGKRVSKPRSSLKKLPSNANKVAKKAKVLVLDAIINNSALINGKWYKLKDRVGKYTLSNVDRTNIILSYKKKKLLLTTDSKNKNLKFKNN